MLVVVIEEPGDALVRITTTNICGSDLHMYEGRTSVEEGKILGHENMGIVEDVGAGVNRVKRGDRVSVPFNIACGTCRNCASGWTSFCLRTNPTQGVDGAAYGYAQMGPYQGGQAEYLRVPYADFNLLVLPPGGDFERDFTMLSDIFPTGYHGAELAGVGPGDTVAVFGAGPVGLLAAHSSYLRGAARVFVVDLEPDRLALAEKFGATPVSIAGRDAAERSWTRPGARAPTGESKRSDTRPTTRRASSIPRWSSMPS
jgi:glutathione-independent formaldehyde dehydrogenase